MTDISKTTKYDSVIEDYLAHVERPDSWNNLYERPYMLSQFPSFHEKNVLDLGCGSGFYTEYALGKGAYVTAIDSSQSMINRLSQRNKSPRLQLICSDIAEPLSSVQSNSFDYVICSLIIHYIKDWEPLFAELYRIMKNDGKLFVSTHHPYLVLGYPLLKNINYFDTTLVEDIWGKKDRPFKVHYFTRSLTNILKPIINSQFKIINIEEPQPSEKCKQMFPTLYQRLNERPGFLFITLGK